ncbi:hypothetical protein CMV_025057, partial [Castanea mollissima]
MPVNYLPTTAGCVLSSVDLKLLHAPGISCSPKSDRAWSHRRWVIKSITGKCSALQVILGKESELVEKIVE